MSLADGLDVPIIRDCFIDPDSISDVQENEFWSKKHSLMMVKSHERHLKLWFVCELSNSVSESRIEETFRCSFSIKCLYTVHKVIFPTTVMVIGCYY